MMRTVLAIILYLSAAESVSAQDRFFLCIQSEDHQPFYVRVSDHTWSSSSVGNLVVPGLGDSTYQVSVGFPRNKYPEQNFRVTFNRKDLGYTLKKAEDKNWVLVSWSDGAKLQPRTEKNNQSIWYGERKKDDAFTNMMAAVVNDSAVLYVASVRESPAKQEVLANAGTLPEVIVDTAVAVVKQDVPVIADSSINSVSVITDTALAVVPLKDTAAVAEPILVYTAPKPAVLLVKDHITPTSRNLLYIDSSGNMADSISVIIDIETDTVVAGAGETAVETSPVTAGGKKPGSEQEGQPVRDSSVSAPEPAESREPADGTENRKMVMINSDCSNFATDNDIDKLRVKILNEPTIDSKLSPVRKLLKTKCVYTRQIRALSELYPNDEARYKFFELCYPFTADTSEFRSLLSLLSEEAYIARFKTLVRIKD